MVQENGRTQTPVAIHEGDIISFNYTNWKGERATRTAKVRNLLYGSNEFHPEKQWLLIAFDMDKKLQRTFAMKDMCNVQFIM